MIQISINKNSEINEIKKLYNYYYQLNNERKELLKNNFIYKLKNSKFVVLKYYPNEINLINIIWNKCEKLSLLIENFLMNKLNNLIDDIFKYYKKSNWTLFINNINYSNNIHEIELFIILCHEIIEKDKECKKYWNNEYNILTEKISKPTQINNINVMHIEKKTSFLTINTTKTTNNNISYPLSELINIEKFNNIQNNSKLKTLKIQIYPKNNQIKTFDKWFNTCNYIYNKTVESINTNNNANFILLRDKLITKYTKKNNVEYKNISDDIILLHTLKYNIINENNKFKKIINEKKDEYNEKIIIFNDNETKNKINEINIEINKKKILLKEISKILPKKLNLLINNWEFDTPKEIRAGAVSDACDAFKSGMANLKAGNIKFFKLGFRKKSVNKCLLLSKKCIKQKNGVFKITPKYFNTKKQALFKMNYKTNIKHKNLIINHDVRLIKQKNKYWLAIPIDIIKSSYVIDDKKYCGIDPGIRSFITSFDNNEVIEYKHNHEMLNKINKKIEFLKELRKTKKIKKLKKSKLNKLENRKCNLTNELHWNVINDILKKNDYVFYGDIKSHNIIKNTNNKALKQNFNDLKFYLFKQRLLFKAHEKNKKVILVNEAYTTQTCSFCGENNKPMCLKNYYCAKCKINVGRDENAAKNIMMKGILN